MGQALEVISGRGGGAALAALTANTGSSFAVRSAVGGSRIYLVSAWVQAATAGEFRVRSPRLHDQGDGIRLRTLADVLHHLIPPGRHQELYSQDVLTVELQSAGAATDIGALLVFYQDLEGAAASLATWADIEPRIEHLAGVRENVAASATAGDVAQPQALTADQDVFKRDKKYALLGITSDVDAGLLGIIGPNTGNFVVGMPVETTSPTFGRQFAELSMQTGLPTIPVIDAANVGATNVAAAHRTASQAINADYIFAELA